MNVNDNYLTHGFILNLETKGVISRYIFVDSLTNVHNYLTFNLNNNFGCIFFISFVKGNEKDKVTIVKLVYFIKS